MQSLRIGLALALALVLAALPGAAQACRMYQPLDPETVRDADIVVTGRITRYRMVLDQEARRQRREMLARDRDMDPGLRESLRRQTGFMSDTAHFEVIVDEVIVGRAGRRLRAVWDNSTFDHPDRMPPGRYLIALRNPRPDASASQEAPAWPVLQSPCSAAFLLPVDSPEAQAVRRVLAGLPPPPPPAPEPPAAPSTGPAAAPAPAADPGPASDYPRQPTGIARALLPWAALVAAILALIAAIILWAGPRRGSDDEGDGAGEA